MQIPTCRHFVTKFHRGCPQVMIFCRHPLVPKIYKIKQNKIHPHPLFNPYYVKLVYDWGMMPLGGQTSTIQLVREIIAEGQWC